MRAHTKKVGWVKGGRVETNTIMEKFHRQVLC